MEIRFEENGAKAYNDEGKEVGLCEYYEKDGKWVLNHTVVDPSMKGQGIAGKLLDCVLEHSGTIFTFFSLACSNTQSNNLPAIPCPFMDGSTTV